MGQSYKTYYRGNLLPFYSNMALEHRLAVLPWNGSKLCGKKLFKIGPRCQLHKRVFFLSLKLQQTKVIVRGRQFNLEEYCWLRPL